jgi:hypothetical protein
MKIPHITDDLLDLVDQAIEEQSSQELVIAEYHRINDAYHVVISNLDMYTLDQQVQLLVNLSKAIQKETDR